jgi:hypothetical protein
LTYDILSTILTLPFAPVIMLLDIGGIEPLSIFGHLGSGELIVKPTAYGRFFVLSRGIVFSEYKLYLVSTI